MSRRIGDHRTPRRFGVRASLTMAFLVASLFGILGRTPSSDAMVVVEDRPTDDPGSLATAHGDSAVFSLVALAPGDRVSECIVVTFRGPVTDHPQVRLYSGGYRGSTGLASNIHLFVEEGVGGRSGDCSGFRPEQIIESTCNLAHFALTHTEFGSAIGTWRPLTPSATRTYRVTVVLAESTPDGLQGSTVEDLVLTWEAQA